MMLDNKEGSIYSFINEQIKMVGADQKKNKDDRLTSIENRLLEMVDSLKIAKYNPKEDDVF